MLKKFPILIQLLIMLTVIMVIPTIVIVCYSTNNLVKYSENEIADSVMAQLMSNSELNERELLKMVQDVITLVDSNDVKKMKGISSYGQMNSDYAKISTGLSLLAHIQAFAESNELVDSVEFIPEEWDYLIDSKKGIIKKQEYGRLDWFEDGCKEMEGIKGYYYPRIDANRPVISYMYRLNRLTTSVKGVIVLNLDEEKMCKLLNYGHYKADSDAFLLKTDGTVLVHNDQFLLFQNKNLPEYMKSILRTKENSGKIYIEQEGKKVLCVYYKAGNRDWIYGATYPMKDMLASVNDILGRQILIIGIIMFMSIAFSVIYATKFSKQMRYLADRLKEKNSILSKESEKGNEITFLTHAFESIEKQEQALYLTVKQKEEDTKVRILYQLLVGEIDEAIDKNKLMELFPDKLYMVALIAVDSKNDYLEHFNAKNRSYQRYLVFNTITNKLSDFAKVQATRFEGGMVAVIMNMSEYDQVQTPRKLKERFEQIQEEIKPIWQSTASIGISGVHTGYESIQDGVYEAREAVNKKLLTGPGSILFWQSDMSDYNEQYYYYPQASSDKIFNYLYTGNLEGIKAEMDSIEREIIASSKHLDYENIKMIFNQLASVAIKFMVERHMNMRKVMGKKSDLYGGIAAAETLKELKEILMNYYETLISYMGEESGKQEKVVEYDQRIIKYIELHYKEDLLYEEVAEKIGISYSYLRRLVKQRVGMSLNDYINKLRVEDIKKMLIETEESIAEITATAGYHNIQSANRYFHKFEGVSLKEFRMLHQNVKEA